MMPSSPVPTTSPFCAPSVGSPPPTNPPDRLEALYHTILRFPVALDGALPDYPPASLSAMQHLVDMVRSLQQTIAKREVGEWQENLPTTPAHLLPYLSEEAADVLEALLHQRDEEQDSRPKGRTELIAQPILPTLNTPLDTGKGGIVTTVVTVANLIPHLLWATMRSSYGVMQLLEGVAIAQSAHTEKLPGMLRLVVLMEITLPGSHWSFDLVTGCPPQGLLPESSLLPFGELPLPSAIAPLSSVHSVGDYLRELTRQIQTVTPDLSPFLCGTCVEMLHPGQGWQSGGIQIKLGLEWIAHSGTIAPPCHPPTDPIDAELLEEHSLIHRSWGQTADTAPVTSVAIQQLPPFPHPETLVRLHASTEESSSASDYHLLTRAIAQIAAHLDPPNPEHNLLTIVTTACQVADAIAAIELPLHPFQPIPLMQALVPQLLWHVSRSACEVMQMVGGIEALVLQPKQDWQQGILRLMVAIQIQTGDSHYAIDLVTGQSIAAIPCLKPNAVCQQRFDPWLGGQSLSIACLQQPLEAKVLLQHLQQQIVAGHPELALLLNGMAIEWAEPDRDWQPAIAHLVFGLELISK
jgi:hypothetical protein